MATHGWRGAECWYQACATTMSPLSPLSPAANCHHLDAKPRGLTSLTTICRDGAQWRVRAPVKQEERVILTVTKSNGEEEREVKGK